MASRFRGGRSARRCSGFYGGNRKSPDRRRVSFGTSSSNIPETIRQKTEAEPSSPRRKFIFMGR